MYVCTVCNKFAGQSFSTVLRHMGTHRYDPGLSIKCGINSCTETYKNFESFRSHIYRKHREAVVNITTNCITNTSQNQEDGQTEEGRRQTDNGSEGDEQETSMGKNDQQRLAALFLLKTREERKLTQVALNGIVQDFHGVWRDAMERLWVKL